MEYTSLTAFRIVLKMNPSPSSMMVQSTSDLTVVSFSVSGFWILAFKSEMVYVGPFFSGVCFV